MSKLLRAIEIYVFWQLEDKNQDYLSFARAEMECKEYSIPLFPNYGIGLALKINRKEELRETGDCL